MEDNDRIAVLIGEVESLREDVKRTDDTVKGMGDMLHSFVQFRSAESHATDRIRSRVIDIDDKLVKHDERFDRIDNVLKQILDKVG